MKKIYLLLFFSMTINVGFSQTLSLYGFTLTQQTGTGVGGSKIYQYQQTSTTYYTLYRGSGDLWYLSYYAGFGGSSGTFTTIKTLNPYPTIDPPCNAVWSTRTSYAIADCCGPIFDGVPSIFMVTIPSGSTSICSPVLSYSGSSTSLYVALQYSQQL